MGKIFFRQPFRYEYKHRVIFIILLNFAVYGIAQLYRELAQYIYIYGPMNPVAVYKYHMYWQFVTYMFVHDYSSIRHILFNMLGLLVFGLQLEKSNWQQGICSFLFTVRNSQLCLFFCSLLFYRTVQCASFGSQWRCVCGFVRLCSFLSPLGNFYLGINSGSCTRAGFNLCRN